MRVALERPRSPLAPTRPRRTARARIHRSGMAAVILLAVIVGAAIFGPRLWGRDPLAQDTLARLSNPSLAHPLGTDKYGRDILARLLSGARWSLAGATIVCLGTSAVGFLIGTLAAMSGQIVDGIIGRF